MAIRKASAQGPVPAGPQREIPSTPPEMDDSLSEEPSGGYESPEMMEILREEAAKEQAQIPKDIFPQPKNTIIEPEVVMISVSKELYEHYRVIIETRDAVLEDHDESASGKASILNTTTSLLKELAKLQQDLYSSDTIARLQQAVFNALKEESPELKDRVLALFEKHLETV